jgi:hypothetical protein
MQLGRQSGVTALRSVENFSITVEATNHVVTAIYRLDTGTSRWLKRSGSGSGEFAQPRSYTIARYVGIKNRLRKSPACRYLASRTFKAL